MNRISGEWAPGQTIEAGEAVRSLLEHPGWALVMDLVAEARDSGMAQLINVRVPLEQAEYAQKLAVLNGMSFPADVAEAVIESADRAIRDAREVAALDAAVGGS
jgi:hypothetical protein